MQRRSDFTIVELIVVLVIMAILLSLSTFLLTRNQANARDVERSTDIETFARGLENRYKQGNPRVTAPGYVATGSYPGVYEVYHISGISLPFFSPAQIAGGYTSDALPGTTAKTFSPPDVTGNYAGTDVSCKSSCGAGIPARTFAQMNVTGVVTKDTYIYQPIDASGNICMEGGCVRFELFWRSEVDGQLKELESKRQ